MNAGRRNGSAEDRKPARSKDTDHADATGYKDKDPVKDKARGAIATLATTNGSTRRSKSPRMPTRAKGTKDVDDTGQGRKDSLEKRTLAASQTAKAPESLRYPESRRSTSEDSVTQERDGIIGKAHRTRHKRRQYETIDDERLHRNHRRRQRRRNVGYGYETWIFWTETTRPDEDPRD